MDVEKLKKLTPPLYRILVYMLEQEPTPKQLRSGKRYEPTAIPWSSEALFGRRTTPSERSSTSRALAALQRMGLVTRQIDMKTVSFTRAGRLRAEASRRIGGLTEDDVKKLELLKATDENRAVLVSKVYALEHQLQTVEGQLLQLCGTSDWEKAEADIDRAIRDHLSRHDEWGNTGQAEMNALNARADNASELQSERVGVLEELRVYRRLEAVERDRSKQLQKLILGGNSRRLKTFVRREQRAVAGETD